MRNAMDLFRQRWRGSMMAVGLFWAISGCFGGRTADYSTLELVEVTGNVTLDDKPLSGVSIVFEDKDRTYSYATTDTSGRYSLEFNSENSGVKPGEKVVRIRYGTIAESDEQSKESQENLPTAKIPARYNQESMLTANVNSDVGSQEFDFSLKND